MVGWWCWWCDFCLYLVGVVFFGCGVVDCDGYGVVVEFVGVW